MLREEVLEASWRAGRELSEPRLDTAVDVNRAIARYLELLKLAALAQRPGDEATAEAIEAVNGLLRQVATPEQQAELDASSLDAYLLDSERERDGRRRLIAARHEPSLEAFLPRRGDGALSLSASDLDLYLTCPLKYKFARVFGIPQEPTINQRFGILIHNVLERFHKERAGGRTRTGCARLMGLFEAGWRRSGFGSSDDELQFRDRAREAMRLYWERERDSEGEPVWLERKFDFQIGEHHVRGRVDRVDRLPDGGHELIDYKTGERKSEADLESDLQLALYRLAAREAWDLEAEHRQLLLRARRREGRGADQARRRRAGRAHRAAGRRGGPRPGLRAAPLADRLQLVRLPADLPGRGELSAAQSCSSPRWRRKRWNSRAIVSAEGRSSPSSPSCSTCSASIRSTSSSISGLAATARPICSS